MNRLSTSRPTPFGNGIVLTMLLVVYIFNFLDRQILSILAAPIQAELDLDDAEMGLLGGFAFALLYSTLAVPLAWLADRTSRSWVITISLVGWSAFTAICGFAQNFWQIFLARLGVGVGEAGGVAPSYAIIGDYFPSHRRSFALAIYSLGIPLGSAAGVLLGAEIAARFDWRAAFIVVGLMGVVIAPLFKWIVRDVARPETIGAPAQPRFLAVAALLAKKPAFWLLSFGAASGSMLGYGLAFWLPSILQRSFGLSLTETGQFYGALLLFGGVAGVMAGGVLGDRLGARDKAWYAWLPALAYVGGALFYVAAFNAGSAILAFALLLVPQALALVWLGPVLSAVQHLVEPRLRATASALFLLINNLMGLGGGIYALGALSKALGPIYGEGALLVSATWSLALYGLAALLMALAGPRLRRGWVEETAG